MSAESSEKFRLTDRHERAAGLLAEDRLKDEEIAAEVGITDRQLRKWKQRPEFAAKVAEYVERYAERILKQGIARKERRVAALHDRWERMQRVIEARADEHADVPGGDTGLLVREAKLVKVYKTDGCMDDGDETLYSAKRDVLVYEYSVDTALLKELRETEKQAAQEAGQWTERRTLTVDIKREAERIAAELGISVEQVLREAGIEGAGPLW